MICIFFMSESINKESEKQNGQSQPKTSSTVQTIVKAFFCVAAIVLVLQQFGSTSEQPTYSSAQGVEAIVVLSTEHFWSNFQELLKHKNYMLDSRAYPLQGQEYWVNVFLTHGHILLVILLIYKFQTEESQPKKTKIMAIGMLIVFIWVFFAPYIKTKRLALEYKGNIIYQSDHFDQIEINQQLAPYEINQDHNATHLPQGDLPLDQQPSTNTQEYIEQHNRKADDL